MKNTTTITAAKALISKCERAALKNEYRCSTIDGVKNLSRSDLDTIVMYCEEFINCGNISQFMEPRGGVGDVLGRAGIRREPFQLF